MSNKELKNSFSALFSLAGKGVASIALLVSMAAWLFSFIYSLIYLSDGFPNPVLQSIGYLLLGLCPFWCFFAFHLARTKQDKEDAENKGISEIIDGFRNGGKADRLFLGLSGAGLVLGVLFCVFGGLSN